MNIESRLGVLLDGFPAPVAYWDGELRNHYANHAYAAWFGMPIEAIRGRHISEVLDARLLEQNRDHLAAALTGAQQTFYRSILDARGSLRHTETHYLPDRAAGDGAGAKGFFVVVFDVTDLRNTKDELDEAQRLGKLGSWAWDVRADRISWSPELYALFGRDPALAPPDYAGLAAYYTAPSWRLHQAAVDQALANGQPYEIELEIIRDDGTRRWVVAHGQVQRDACGTVVKLQGTGQDVTERKRMELALRASRNELREMVAYQEAAREEERRHIARELHDELGQLLSALNMDVGVLRLHAAADPRQMKTITDMQGIVDRIFQVTRNVTTSLRPGALEFGLVPALEWLAQDFDRRWCIECTLDAPDEDWPLDEFRTAMMFRIAQESLTNAARHACASRVEISLRCDGETLRLEVRDNGCGFDVAQSRAAHHFGLLGMRERARALGGHLQIDSTPGAGTSIVLAVPALSSDLRRAGLAELVRRR
jgi:PAS domain S-box-containing protein